jgi:hypothetical protein
MASRRQHRGGILGAVLIAAYLQGTLAAAAAPTPATPANGPHKDKDSDNKDKDKDKGVDLKPCVAKCIEDAKSGCHDAADIKCLCPATASQKHLVQDIVTCILLSDDDDCAVATSTDAVLLLGPLESACDALGKPIPSSVLIGAANTANTVVPPDNNNTTTKKGSGGLSPKTKTAQTTGGGGDDDDDDDKTSTATDTATATTATPPPPPTAESSTTTAAAAVDTAQGPAPSASTQESSTSVVSSDPREPTDSSPFAVPNNYNSSDAWRRMASPSVLGLVLGLAGALLWRV